MHQLLFATDGSVQAADAAHFINMLALPAGTQIHVVAVVSSPTITLAPTPDGISGGWGVMEQIRGEEEEYLQKALADCAASLRREGVTVTTSLRHGASAHEILTAGDEVKADLLVVGSRGLTGLDSFLLGSVARNVAKHSRRPVLVTHGPRNGIREVVAGVDESEHAAHALSFLSQLPLPVASRITVVHALRPYDPFPGFFPTDREEYQDTVEKVRRQQVAEAEELVTRSAETLRGSDRSVDTAVREGDPASEVLALAAERGADLIVVGARGVSAIEGLLVGSVADRLLKACPCSVLIVP